MLPEANADRSPIRGQRFFSSMVHWAYDFGLYRLVTRQFWGCPTEVLLDSYAENVTRNHLEVGVGSGFFLARTLCADYVRKLVILDLNRTCLRKSAHRLRSLKPAPLRHDIRVPLVGDDKYTSVGMNYVLHCIPGGASHVIFSNVAAVLNQGGVFFGATLLTPGFARSPFAWLFMKLLNLVGIFNNQEHCHSMLKEALEANFSEIDLRRVGHALIFRAVK